MKKNSEKQIVCVSGQPRSLNHDNRTVLSRMLNAEIDLTREPISKRLKGVTPAKVGAQKEPKILDSPMVAPGGLENCTACLFFAGTTTTDF